MKPDLSDDQVLRELTEQMPRFMGLLHGHMAGDTLAILHESSLTLPQMVALHTLRYAGPLSISGLCEALHLSTSATSHLVDRLVDGGYVTRVEDPSDRRQKRVTLAAEGLALTDRLSATRAVEMEGVVLRLDPDLRRSLLTVVLAMIEQLSRRA